MDRPALNVLSLCSGYGGLDLGLRLACPSARVVAYVEREAYAAELLASRMEDGRLDQAPVWSDLARFDGKPWRGVVDCVVGGFPCTDISNAGKRAGIEGEHSSLWFEFVRVIRDVEPSLVFVENVRPLLVRGLDRVLGDLASLRFDAEWGVFSAASVGAPHLRERVFLLAHSNKHGLKGVRGLVCRDGDTQQRNNTHGQSGTSVADADHERRQRGRRAWDGRNGPQDEGLSLADPNEPGCSQQPDSPGGGREAHAFTANGGGEALAYPKGLGRREGWAQSGRKPRGPHASLIGLRHVFPPGPDSAEWASWNGPQPCLRRGADGLANRVDRLRALGNGVVPQQAALAFQVLASRLGLERILTR